MINNIIGVKVTNIKSHSIRPLKQRTNKQPDKSLFDSQTEGAIMDRLRKSATTKLIIMRKFKTKATTFNDVPDIKTIFAKQQQANRNLSSPLKAKEELKPKTDTRIALERQERCWLCF